MTCKNCGAENNIGAEECVECGAPLTSTIQVREKNTIGIISSLVMLASIFLPFYQVSVLGTTINASLADGTAWIPVVIGAGIGLYYAYKGDTLGQIICGVFAFAYLLFEAFSIKNSLSASEYSELSIAIARSMILRGPGFYALLVGGIGLIVAGMTAKKRS